MFGVDILLYDDIHKNEEKKQGLRCVGINDYLRNLAHTHTCIPYYIAYMNSN